MNLREWIAEKTSNTTIVVAVPAGEFNEERLYRNERAMEMPNGAVQARLSDDLAIEYNPNFRSFLIYNSTKRPLDVDVYDFVRKALQEIGHQADENARPAPIMISRNFMFERDSIDFAFNNIYNTFNPGKYNHLSTQVNIAYEKPGYPYRIAVSLVKSPQQPVDIMEIGFINQVNGVAELKEILTDMNKFGVQQTTEILSKIRSTIDALSGIDISENGSDGTVRSEENYETVSSR